MAQSLSPASTAVGRFWMVYLTFKVIGPPVQVGRGLPTLPTPSVVWLFGNISSPAILQFSGICLACLESKVAIEAIPSVSVFTYTQIALRLQFSSRSLSHLQLNTLLKKTINSRARPLSGPGRRVTSGILVHAQSNCESRRCVTGPLAAAAACACCLRASTDNDEFSERAVLLASPLHAYHALCGQPATLSDLRTRLVTCSLICAQCCNL